MGEDIADRVRQIVAAQLGLREAEVRVGSSFVDLGADSFAVLELALAIEEAFDVEIPEAQSLQLRTVAEAIGQVVAARQRVGG